MKTAGNPQNLPRRLRAIGVVAGLVAGAIGAVGPGAFAQGTTGTAASATTGGGQHDGSTAGRLPAGAVRTTTTKMQVGRSGSTFTAMAPTGTVSPNVVGGTAVPSSSYPGVVGIRTIFIGDWAADGSPIMYQLTCTGTVVSSTKVLTAGHCATGTPFGTTYVIAGRSNLDDASGGQVASVATTWTDQNFNLKALNAGTESVPRDDVSVLTLKQPLAATYVPVTMTGQGNQGPYVAGSPADVVGYGLTGLNNNDAGILRKATLEVKSDATCATMTGYDSTRMVCAGTPASSTTPVGACHGDSGGPLFSGTTEIGITDWGTYDCSTAPNGYSVFERLSRYNSEITTDMARHGLVNLDWDGDGHSDLMATQSDGSLLEYTGSGFANDGYGGFAGAATLGTDNWSGFNKLFRVTSWNNDGLESIMARDSAGNLYQYKNDGVGNITGRVLVGTGWNWFSDIMVTNNWTGDGQPNILGRTSTGDLYLYTSNGAGGWENGGTGIKIGTAWNWFNTVLTPGDWKSDGHQALIGRTSNGDLYLYESDGHGGWMNGGTGIKIGTAWNMFKTFMSPGDWNGDDQVDLIGITPTGAMSLYTTDGHGNWLTGVGQPISSGWNAFTKVF